VAIVGSLGVTVGAVVVQTTVAPSELVTVHVITPPGLAPPIGPVTMAVRVEVPPKVGVPEELIVTVGITCEIPRLTELEDPPK
jgi:hypothetical protein